jgi:acylpyruvate hydrolase
MDDGQKFRCHGAFGPWLVTPDAVPPRAHGLRIQGRFISVATSLEPGDVIITGTPGGVGAARKPPVLMRPDVFDVDIEGMGVLSNPVEDG